MPRLALLQLTAQQEPEINLANTKKAIERAADGGAQIICTQELFTTPYFPIQQSSEPFKHAVEIPGQLTRELGKIAAELGVVIVASGFEKRSTGVFHNTAFVIDTDGAYLGKYRKMHTPQDASSEDKYYFTQSDDGYQVFDTKFGKLGVLIGWDQWFSEPARLNALMGADIIIYPNSIGCHSDLDGEECDAKHEAWQIILRGHAIANACYVATINRCGTEAETEYWGQSFVADQAGRIIASATEAEQDTIVYADVNLEAIAEHRANWPFFRDRRIDSYADISKRLIE